jgi:hypothetical protein
VVLPARSHEQRLIIAEAAQVLGVSEPTLYRALTEHSPPAGLAPRRSRYAQGQSTTMPDGATHPVPHKAILW